MLQEWKVRPLEEVYPFVFLDAIHYKVKEDGKYISKAFYTVLGVRVDGKKYPIVFTYWRNKWENLSVYFQYPADIRRVIYTTNIIESVHRQFTGCPLRVEL